MKYLIGIMLISLFTSCGDDNNRYKMHVMETQDGDIRVYRIDGKTGAIENWKNKIEMGEYLGHK